MSYFKQSNFSRSLINDLKQGAYYTDLDHCKRLGRIFDFPTREEVSVLEPAMGDGSAVLAVTGKEKADSGIKIFGVELNTSTYEEVKDNKLFDYLLNADFLNGIKVSHNVFSFCFANPPYGVIQDEKERLETKFVEKLHHYMMNDGVLALVIPHYVLTDDSFLKVFFARFNPIAQFRFDDDVYKQFQQIVVVGMKRSTGIGYLRKTYDDYKESIINKEQLEYLPRLEDVIERKVKVIPSKEKVIEYFTTLTFNSKEAGENLNQSTLYSLIKEKAFVPKFHATSLGNPPVPLKKDLLYLCAISGGGQGLVGSEKTNDLHLQRGVVKTVVDNVVVQGADSKQELIEKKYSKVCLNIIQNDGSIANLE